VGTVMGGRKNFQSAKKKSVLNTVGEKRMPGENPVEEGSGGGGKGWRVPRRSTDRHTAQKETQKGKGGTSSGPKGGVEKKSATGTVSNQARQKVRNRLGWSGGEKRTYEAKGVIRQKKANGLGGSIRGGQI